MTQLKKERKKKVRFVKYESIDRWITLDILSNTDRVDKNKKEVKIIKIRRKKN